MREKRILIISKSLTSGGAERVAANVATHLNYGNNKAWLLVLDGSVRTYESEAPIIDMNMPWSKTFFGKVKWYIKAFNEIKKIKKSLKITHSISFLSEPDLLNVLTKRYGRAIVSVRNKRSALNRNIFNKVKDKFIFNSADRIVALSKGTKDDLVSFYNTRESKIDVIYNACDINNIKKKADEELVSNFEFKIGKTVITAGRLTNQKGQWHLIRAFKYVLECIPDAKLFILGQGETEDYLQKLIDDYGLKKSIFLLGYHKNPYYFLKKSDIFVFPSLYEGFGNILLEAMACGLPIISSDCIAGPRELLDPGTAYTDVTKNKIHTAKYGILIPVCNGKKYSAEDSLIKEERLMAQAIITMLCEDKERMKYSDLSNKRILDFADDKIYEEWLNILN